MAEPEEFMRAGLRLMVVELWRWTAATPTPVLSVGVSAGVVALLAPFV